MSHPRPTQTNQPGAEDALNAAPNVRKLTISGEFVNGFSPFFQFIQGGEEESVSLHGDKIG